MAWSPKVGRHVRYKTAAGKWKPCVITNVDSPTQLDLRIGHAVGNTLANKARATKGVNQVDRWIPS
jgi:hypothetical protein